MHFGTMFQVNVMFQQKHSWIKAQNLEENFKSCVNKL